MIFFFLTIRTPPKTTLTNQLFPDTTLFRSPKQGNKRKDDRQDQCRGGHARRYRHGPPSRRNAERKRPVRNRGRGRRQEDRREAADGVGGRRASRSCGSGRRPGPGTRRRGGARGRPRSEAHTSELQSLMPISHAVFRLKQKKEKKKQ